MYLHIYRYCKHVIEILIHPGQNWTMYAHSQTIYTSNRFNFIDITSLTVFATHITTQGYIYFVNSKNQYPAPLYRIKITCWTSISVVLSLGTQKHRSLRERIISSPFQALGHWGPRKRASDEAFSFFDRPHWPSLEQTKLLAEDDIWLWTSPTSRSPKKGSWPISSHLVLAIGQQKIISFGIKYTILLQNRAGNPKWARFSGSQSQRRI